jgi:hypothetical protein
VNGGGQQNIRMTVSGSNNTYDLTGLTSGAVVSYSFTVGIAAGGATDTGWSNVTCCSGVTSSVASSSKCSVASSSVAVSSSSKSSSSVAVSSSSRSSSSVAVSSSSRSSSSVAVSSSSKSSAASSVAGCSTPAFVNGTTYATGAKVKNVGYEYTCTVGGWCSIGGPYEPGVGWAWTNAWTQGGACN